MVETTRRSRARRDAQRIADVQAQRKADAEASNLIASDCCFVTSCGLDEFSVCDLFSWTGMTDTTVDDSNSDVTTEWGAGHRQNHNEQRTSSSSRHAQHRRERDRTRQKEKEAKRLKSKSRDRARDRTKGVSRKVEQDRDRNGNGNSNGGHDRIPSTSVGNKIGISSSNSNKRDGNGIGKKKGRGGLFSKNSFKSNMSTKGNNNGGGGGYLSHSQDHDHPPPVIALSRSSFSAGSDSTAESALETTEVDRDRGTESGSRSNNRRERHGHRRDRNGNGSGSKNSRHHRRRPQHYGTKTSRSSPSENPADDGYEDEYDDCDMPHSDAVDFAARHELLINALFEDAKHRQMLKHASEAANNANASSPESPQQQQSSPNSNNANTRTPPRSSTAKLYQYPSSNASVISKGSHSRHSTASTTQSQRSYNTQGSDLLSPSSHQFKKSLSKRRIKTLQMMEARHQNRARRHLKTVKTNSSSYSNTSLNSNTPGRHGNSNGGNPNESTSDSSCTSFTTLSNDRSNGEVNVAHSFLHASCRLQKDSGKGIPPGTGKMAHGRDSAMAKLVRKMDQLAEVEEEGSFANAVLTRVAAKDMTLARGELQPHQPQQDIAFVETRSMLAVKMGFASLRYGVLVHWNTTSGLAEMIVLRKMCSDSFMKVKTKNFKTSASTGTSTTVSTSTATTKSWRKRMRRTSSQFMGSRGVGAGSSGNHPSVISPAKTDAGESYDSDGLIETVGTAPY